MKRNNVNQHLLYHLFWFEMKKPRVNGAWFDCDFAYTLKGDYNLIWIYHGLTANSGLLDFTNSTLFDCRLRLGNPRK